jgi:hypothetical protein
MAPATDRAVKEGEGTHATPGPIRRGTPRAALGASAKELRLRRSRRKGIVDITPKIQQLAAEAFQRDLSVQPPA